MTNGEGRMKEFRLFQQYLERQREESAGIGQYSISNCHLFELRDAAGVKRVWRMAHGVKGGQVLRTYRLPPFQLPGRPAGGSAACVAGFGVRGARRVFLAMKVD